VRRNLLCVIRDLQNYLRTPYKVLGKTTLIISLSKIEHWIN